MSVFKHSNISRYCLFGLTLNDIWYCLSPFSFSKAYRSSAGVVTNADKFYIASRMLSRFCNALTISGGNILAIVL